MTAGGGTYAVRQNSYAGRRLECGAVRMNSGAWGSLPVSACTSQGDNGGGPDRIVRYGYDAADRVTGTTGGYGTGDAITQSATYAATGAPLTVTDGKGNRTAYEYDGFDRPWKTTFPGGSYEQAGYDAYGFATSRVLRDGQTIGWQYDALGRPVLMTVPQAGSNAGDVSYVYDMLGHLRSATKAPGHAVTFTYDALGRRTGEASLHGGLVMQYDAAGRRVRTTWTNDGFNVTYGYAVTGEMTTIREGDAGLVLASYSYDALGRRTSLVRGNGTTTTWSYDASSRLTGLSHDLAGSAYDVATTFTYNPAGQIATSTRSNDAYAWTGHYNVDRGYGVNGLNQYTQVAGITPTYDARGNLTYGGSNSYQYTPLNQLWHVPNVTFMDYDALGRLYFNVNGGEIFGYDGANLTTELDYTGPWQPVPTASVGAIRRRYVFGPGTDAPVVVYEGAGTTDRVWLYQDERNSVVALAGLDGQGRRY